jgi:hypothetical protein
MFRVGQKVVCVDDTAHGQYSPFRPSGKNLEGLKKGAVYTIRYVGISLGVSVVRVNEIKRRYNNIIDGENVYASARFRPIVSRPTSIAVFEEILRKVNAPGRVTEVVRHG